MAEVDIDDIEALTLYMVSKFEHELLLNIYQTDMLRNAVLIHAAKGERNKIPRYADWQYKNLGKQKEPAQIVSVEGVMKGFKEHHAKLKKSMGARAI